MLNTDATIIDNEQSDNRINFSETILDYADTTSGTDKVTGINGGDTSEMTIIGQGSIGDYRIIEVLSEGSQAKLYMVELDGRRYVAKVYGRNWQPVKTLRLFFFNHSHENVMRVLASGRELGCYYEIYPYYGYGSLADYSNKNGRLSVDFIRQYVVPGVNDGLRFLHSNNIVHCDIKPANLYLEKCGEQWKVVIGDLGSCRVMDSDGMVRATLEGTVNFSVPVQDYYGVKTFPKEYDYVSLGMSLYRLYSGANLMDGLKLDERARLWERVSGISVDDVRLKNLLTGLINKDFDKVWGYEELRRWSDTGWNSDKKRRGAKGNSGSAGKTVPMIFGTVDGNMIRVNTLHELADACRDNWELAKTVIRRFDTMRFIRQFDDALYAKVDKEVNGKKQNENIMLFKVIYMMDKTNRICYKGKDMGSLNDFMTLLSKRDEDAVEFVTFDLLTFYMEMIEADQNDIDRLDELVKLYRLNAMGLLGMIDGICRAFSSDQLLDIDGNKIESVDGFIDHIAGKKPDEINEIINREEVCAWFAAMGFAKEIDEMKALG